MCAGQYGRQGIGFQESSCQGRCAFLHRTATDRQSVRRATKEDIYTCTRRHLRVTLSHPRSRLAHTVLPRRRARTASPPPPHTPPLPRARPKRPRKARVVRGRHRECRGIGGRNTVRLLRTCQIEQNICKTITCGDHGGAKPNANANQRNHLIQAEFNHRNHVQ
jgi:hypothetical protein